MSWRAKEAEKRRLMKLYRQTWHSWRTGAYHNDRRGGYLCRGYPYSTSHANNKKWWLKHSNRRFRRRKNEYWREDDLQRGGHKKSFDLWWTLF